MGGGGALYGVSNSQPRRRNGFFPTKRIAFAAIGTHTHSHYTEHRTLDWSCISNVQYGGDVKLIEA